MKKYCIILYILLDMVFPGCRYEPPATEEVLRRLTQYYQSINLPFDIEEIHVVPKSYNREYQILEVRMKAKIYSEDREKLLYIADNTYRSRFYHITYGYWFGRFELIRKPPPDSVIYNLAAEKFAAEKNSISIVKIGEMDELEKFYRVEISLIKKGSAAREVLQISQDEFGIWKNGINELITPESTVKSFLNEVNRGNTQKARRYFSYDYKSGYDDIDRNNLEKLFARGSIENIQIADVYTISDTAWLNLSVQKTGSDTFTTDLELIKLGIEWRINYKGWDWKFKPSEN